jgi:hypothetical protein
VHAALAIEEIKLSYNLTDWTGDPCVPIPHAWIACSFGSNSVPSIIEVNLAAYNLTGPISPSFANLLNLLTLNLSDNRLTGSIPPSIWNIAKLNTLDLSKNNLFGNLITTNTTPCPGNLTYLNLARNNFNGTFPSLLLNCSFYNLHRVYCDNNNFGGILDMETLDIEYASYWLNMLISMVNNNITGLMPNNGTYSPVLLGGNPCCNNPASETLYYVQLNCRYNSSGGVIIVNPGQILEHNNLLML